MKYYIIEPPADAEVGEESLIDFSYQPRKIIALHVYLFSNPESDLIQAYPTFLVTERFKNAIEQVGLTGVKFFPCEVSKSPQYNELSETTEIPIIWV